MTAIAFRALRVVAPHPGRRASHWRTARNTIVLTAALAMTTGFLLASNHQQLPRTQPRCVLWHSCACRFPGQGARWPGHNKICAITWGKPQTTGGRP